MRKKLLAIVMSLTMILTFMPALAFAEESGEDNGSGVLSISYKLSDERDAITIYEYEVDDYEYYPCPGDQLVVVTSDGETTYTYPDEEEAEEFISGDGESIPLEEVHFRLVQEEDGTYKIEVEYEGQSTQIPVTVLETNVSGITYAPKKTAITLYTGVDEIEETDDDGNVVKYYDVRNVYDFEGDEVTIEYSDETSETLFLDEIGNWDYVTEVNGECVSLYEAQQETPWQANDTYEIYLKARGEIDTTHGITVTIAESPYKSFTFKQSEEYLYVFEDEGDRFNYDPVADEYVLNVSDEYDTRTYLGSEGDVLIFTLADGTTEEVRYATITGDPDYPHGWSGFVKTDASGNMTRLEREVKIKEDQLVYENSNGLYVNDTATLTYMGADSTVHLVSYVGYQVWFDPNGGEGNANTAVPLGMSVNELVSLEPGDFMSKIQPTRSGYTFSGWYEKDSNDNLKANPYDFDTKISEETFLYAKWEKAADPVANGTSHKVSGNTYQVVSKSGQTVSFTKANNAKTITVPATVKINGTTFKVVQINAKAFTGSKIRTVKIGKNVKTIKKNAFKGSKATKIIVQSKLLTKAKVKGSLKSSKVKTVQVKVGKKALNKKYVKKYKKIFTKKNAGKKVKVK